MSSDENTKKKPTIPFTDRAGDFYSPPGEDWVHVSEATRKNWPQGIPETIVGGKNNTVFREYCGAVWMKVVPNIILAAG